MLIKSLLDGRRQNNYLCAGGPGRTPEGGMMPSFPEKFRVYPQFVDYGALKPIGTDDESPATDIVSQEELEALNKQTLFGYVDLEDNRRVFSIDRFKGIENYEYIFVTSSGDKPISLWDRKDKRLALFESNNKFDVLYRNDYDLPLNTEDRIADLHKIEILGEGNGFTNSFINPNGGINVYLFKPDGEIEKATLTTLRKFKKVTKKIPIEEAGIKLIKKRDANGDIILEKRTVLDGEGGIKTVEEPIFIPNPNVDLTKVNYKEIDVVLNDTTRVEFEELNASEKEVFFNKFSDLQLRYEDHLHQIPGKIDLVKYNWGPAGISYNDSDRKNSGGAIRQDEFVDIGADEEMLNEDLDGDGENEVVKTYYLTQIKRGERINYLTEFNQPGDYTVQVIYKSSGRQRIKLKVVDQSITLNLPNTQEKIDTFEQDLNLLSDALGTHELVLEGDSYSTPSVFNLYELEFNIKEKLGEKKDIINQGQVFRKNYLKLKRISRGGPSYFVYPLWEDRIQTYTKSNAAEKQSEDPLLEDWRFIPVKNKNNIFLIVNRKFEKLLTVLKCENRVVLSDYADVSSQEWLIEQIDDKDEYIITSVENKDGTNKYLGLERNRYFLELKSEPESWSFSESSILERDVFMTPPAFKKVNDIVSDKQFYNIRSEINISFSNLSKSPGAGYYLNEDLEIKSTTYEHVRYRVNWQFIPDLNGDLRIYSRRENKFLTANSDCQIQLSEFKASDPNQLWRIQGAEGVSGYRIISVGKKSFIHSKPIGRYGHSREIRLSKYHYSKFQFDSSKYTSDRWASAYPIRIKDWSVFETQYFHLVDADYSRFLCLKNNELVGIDAFDPMDQSIQWRFDKVTKNNGEIIGYQLVNRMSNQYLTYKQIKYNKDELRYTTTSPVSELSWKIESSEDGNSIRLVNAYGRQLYMTLGDNRRGEISHIRGSNLVLLTAQEIESNIKRYSPPDEVERSGAPLPKELISNYVKIKFANTDLYFDYSGEYQLSNGNLKRGEGDFKLSKGDGDEWRLLHTTWEKEKYRIELKSDEDIALRDDRDYGASIYNLNTNNSKFKNYKSFDIIPLSGEDEGLYFLKYRISSKDYYVYLEGNKAIFSEYQKSKIEFEKQGTVPANKD